MNSVIESYACEFCGKLCKNHNSWRNHTRLCKLNPQRQLTTYEKYGAIPGFNNVGRSAWNKGKTAETDASMAEISHKLQAKYKSGELIAYQPMNDQEVRIKHKESMRKAYSQYTKRTPGKFKYGYYNGIWCDSSWELAYLLYCYEHNIEVERNKFGFTYIWQGTPHSYFPDFYLPSSNCYVEIKGYKSDRDIAKIEQFSENLLVLEAADMQPILNEIEAKYGKQFTELYSEK
jgi:hypothetical protein